MNKCIKRTPDDEEEDDEELIKKMIDSGALTGQFNAKKDAMKKRLENMKNMDIAKLNFQLDPDKMPALLDTKALGTGYFSFGAKGSFKKS